MAKKKTDTPANIFGPDAEYQTRDDVDTILRFDRLCNDRPRYTRAKTNLRRATKLVSRGRGRGR